MKCLGSSGSEKQSQHLIFEECEEFITVCVLHKLLSLNVISTNCNQIKAADFLKSQLLQMGSLGLTRFLLLL